MFVLIGTILGAVTGALIARRRKGATADIVQYAVVYAMIFAMAGLFVSLFIFRATV